MLNGMEKLEELLGPNVTAAGSDGFANPDVVVQAGATPDAIPDGMRGALYGASVAGAAGDMSSQPNLQATQTFENDGITRLEM